MPFTSSWSTGSDEHTIEVEVLVSSEADLGLHTPRAALSPIVDLVNLAACGGLSGSHYDPQDATARVVAHDITGRRVRWVLDVGGVAPTILKNVEGALLYFDRAIARIDVASVLASPTMVDARGYGPQRFFPPPFRFTDDRQNYRSLDVEIAFEGATKEMIDRVEMEAFGIWVCAASAGCFCDNEFPPQLCKVYLGDNRHGQDAIILGLDEMILPEPMAADSLVNTFTWAHHNIARISSVDFYD